jgi:hypothetical protein
MFIPACIGKNLVKINNRIKLLTIQLKFMMSYIVLLHPITMFGASSSLSFLAHPNFFIFSFTQVFVHYVGHGSHNSTRSGTHTRIDLLNDFMSPVCASMCFKVKFNLCATCALFTNVHVPLYGYKRIQKRRKGAKENH